MVRRGLITARGGSKHDKLMSSMIKFLISKCDASLPDRADVQSLSWRIKCLIKGIYVFDVEKEELVRSFRNLDEYLGYTMINSTNKKVIIDV